MDSTKENLSETELLRRRMDMILKYKEIKKINDRIVSKNRHYFIKN